MADIQLRDMERALAATGADEDMRRLAIHRRRAGLAPVPVMEEDACLAWSANAHAAAEAVAVSAQNEAMSTVKWVGKLEVVERRQRIGAGARWPVVCSTVLALAAPAGETVAWLWTAGLSSRDYGSWPYHVLWRRSPQWAPLFGYRAPFDPDEVDPTEPYNETLRTEYDRALESILQAFTEVLQPPKEKPSHG